MKLNYCVIGTNDMESAIAFYSALFAKSGIEPFRASDRMIYWLGADFAFAIARPFDGEPATIGNGSMAGFAVGDDADVRQMHALAVKLGGSCEGEPGQRGPKYSAYVRDLDGNKLCFSD